MKHLPSALVVSTALAFTSTVHATASLPTALVGQWMTTTAGASYYVTSGGQINGPSGSGVTFTFSADGRYSEGAYYNVAIYNCNTGFFGFTEGVVSATNGKLTFKPITASLRQWATCSGQDTKQDVSDDPTIMKVKTLEYRLSSNQAQAGTAVLTLMQANGQPYATLHANGSATTRPAAATRPWEESTATGSVSRPSGQSVKGVVVLACPVNGGCENTAAVRYAVITTNGQQASFQLEGLGRGPYNVLAWKDVDGDGRYSSGDFAGGFSKDGQNMAAVTVPARGIALRLQVIP